ncbi:ABC transporter ATP-binding protein [Acetobacter malorum]|uniref:ABC transporter ATP-binding protein n=1 Tax=Acetobacter malorum TaxID=178901 RepID=UPI0015C4E92F|nr:ATP-binding cassette domain-containing protein [Acetobacter malorum]
MRDLAWQSPDGSFILHVPEFSVHAGDRLAITGPSGCGKSTLLGLLSLALQPVVCQIFTLQGMSVNLTDTTARARMQKAALRARSFGFVPQMSALLPFLSIYDNIRLPLDILNTKAPARLKTLAQRLDIEACLTRMPARISVGQRQRAAIARALVHSPHLLLADEPTAALHPDQAENVMHLLSTETAADGAVVVVTHDPELASKAGYALIPAILDGQTTRISTAPKALA